MTFVTGVAQQSPSPDSLPLRAASTIAAVTSSRCRSATTKTSIAFGRNRDSKTRPRYSCVTPRSRPCPIASITVTPTWPVACSTASITVSTRSRMTIASTLCMRLRGDGRGFVDGHDDVGRNDLDRLQDPAGDLVRVAERVRAPVLEVPAVAVRDEAVRDPDRRAAVRDAVVELVDRLRLVQAREPHVVVGAVDGDVCVLLFVEGGHQRLEVVLAADLPHVLGREVRVHARAVPVVLHAERLRVEVDVDAVLLAEAQEQVARDPQLVGGPLGALAEDLELPLALRHLGVDPLEVDPRLEAEVDVRLDDLSRDVADVLEADARVVLALRRGEALRREPEGRAVAVEEVLLLEAEPGAGVIRDRRAAVRRMRRPVREQHLAHDEHAVRAGGVLEERDRLQQAVRARALGLLRRAPVEVPDGEVLERRRDRERLDLRLAAQVRDGVVAVEPDVFELVLGHAVPPCRTFRQPKKDPADPGICEASLPLGALLAKRGKCSRARRRRRCTWSEP